MIFDKKVTFYTNNKRYVPKVGYVGMDGSEEIRRANVTNVSNETVSTLFGGDMKNGQVIRLYSPLPKGYNWSYCKIEDDDRKYKRLLDRNTLKGVAYIVGETSD